MESKENELSGSRSARGGLTLFEVIITLGLFIVITAFSAPLLSNLTNFYTETIFASDLMESTKIAQERLVDDLLSARILSVAKGMSPSLVFVVPVQVDDGTKVDFIDENGNVHWGAVEAGGPKEDSPTDPHRVTLAALPTRQISEKSAELDLNHDGDTSDYFQLGSLRARTSGGVETILNSDRLVLSQIGAGAFDADGDQVADPLFKIEGETFIDSNLNGIHDESEAFVDANLNETWDGILTISLLAFNTDRAGRGHSFLYRTRIHLQNN